MFEQIFSGGFAFLSRSQGSNCFLLKGEKETALIDSSTADNNERLISSLSEHGVSPEDISLVLHTHGHADHFGLDYLFRNAKVAMHEEDAKRLNSKDAEFACIQFFPNTKMPNVNEFLKSGQKIDLGGIALLAISTPGHTAGSVCFYLQSEKALFSGDTLFFDGFGRTDLASGSPAKILESLKKIQKIPLEAVLPGHGPLIRGADAISKRVGDFISLASTNAFL